MKGSVQFDAGVYVLYGRTLWNCETEGGCSLLPRSNNNVLPRDADPYQSVLGMDVRSNWQETCCPYRNAGHTAGLPPLRLC
jgi:hypothetical protein